MYPANRLNACLLCNSGFIELSTNDGHFHGVLDDIDYNHIFEGNQIASGIMGDYVLSQQMFDQVVDDLYQQAREESLKPIALKSVTTNIDSLPEVEIGQSQIDQGLICVICQEEYELQMKSKKLSCSHVFHKDCLAQWLKDHADCPICRSYGSSSTEEDASGVGSRFGAQNDEDFPEIKSQQNLAFDAI